MLTEKGLRTRNHLIAVSAELFNQYGYAGTSVDAILEKSGYSKGALYRTFKDKDEMVLEAFRFNFKVLQTKMLGEIATVSSSKEKLNTMFDLYTDVVLGKIFPGGCPLLNTAIEVDDTNELLRSLVAKAFDSWRKLIKEIVKEGIEKGEFPNHFDVQRIPNFIIATIEGSITLSKVQRDTRITVDNIQVVKQILDV